MQCGGIGFVSANTVAMVATASEDTMREYVNSGNDGDGTIHFSSRRFSRYVFTARMARQTT